MKSQTLQNVQRIKELAHIKYESRLTSVKNYCQSRRYKIPKLERNNAQNTTSRWRKEMWWDINNGFAWCCVYKVASSSLVTHMINIAGWDWDEYLQHLVDIGIERRRWRDYMIEELYPLPRKAMCIFFLNKHHLLALLGHKNPNDCIFSKVFFFVSPFRPLIGQ